jgi:hydroxymethylbilane synthase
MAGLATVADDTLTFRGEVLAPDGSDYVETAVQIPLTVSAREEGERAGREAGESIRPRAQAWLDL